MGDAPTCDVCGDSRTLAIGRFRVLGGCIALRGQEEQYLCRQHLHSCEPLGGDEDDETISVIEDLTVDGISAAMGYG
jgi:hypothetical protein